LGGFIYNPGNLHKSQKISIIIADGLPGSSVVCRCSDLILRSSASAKPGGGNLHRSLKEICTLSASAKAGG
jgi:hypothetical protein